MFLDIFMRGLISLFCSHLWSNNCKILLCSNLLNVSVFFYMFRGVKVELVKRDLSHSVYGWALECFVTPLVHFAILRPSF